MRCNKKISNIKICKQTKEVQQDLRNFSENKVPLPKWLIKDLLDDTILYDSKQNKRIYKNIVIHPKIGKNYQAIIPQRYKRKFISL